MSHIRVKGSVQILLPSNLFHYIQEVFLYKIFCKIFLLKYFSPILLLSPHEECNDILEIFFSFFWPLRQFNVIQYKVQPPSKISHIFKTHSVFNKKYSFKKKKLILRPSNNVVTVSDGQQTRSAIHLHLSILPQTPLPSRLLNTSNSKQANSKYKEVRINHLVMNHIDSFEL